jgi:hypothetical protein
MRATAILLFCGLLAGCADSNKHPSTQPSSVRDRQEQALRDPFGYGPNTDEKRYDISGGGLKDFDRDAFRKDVDRVLNP